MKKHSVEGENPNDLFNLHIQAVGAGDHWITCFPLDSREYLVIKRWWEPMGFVLCIYSAELQCYRSEEFTPTFKQASKEFVDWLFYYKFRESAV